MHKMFSPRLSLRVFIDIKYVACLENAYKCLYHKTDIKRGVLYDHIFIPESEQYKIMTNNQAHSKTLAK